MQSPQKILILGAGYGGLITALRLAKKSRQLPLQITLVNATPVFQERIRLHQLASGQTLKQHPLSKLLHNTGIDFIQGYVEKINPDQHQVQVTTTEQTLTLSYDKLVYALGSFTNQNSVAGIRDHAYTLESAAHLKNSLPTIAAQNGQLLIVGGGLTAIEAATELAEAYPNLRVNLLSRTPLLANYAPAAREYLYQVLSDLKINVYEDQTVSRIEAKHVFTDSETSFSYDVLLWIGGMQVSSLAQESGIEVNERGQILLDATMASISHPDIYGVGDAVEFSPATGLKIRMACATALPMGVQLADNLLAQYRQQTPQAFHLSYLVHCMSLGRKRGLVQFVYADDSPKDRVITGRLAAFIKETICRYTLFSIRQQSYAPNFYIVPSGNQAPHSRPTQSYTAHHV